MASPSMIEQAEFIEYLIRTGRMANGEQCADRWVRLTKEQMDILLGIQGRLEKMAPFEDKIRKMVVGR